VDKGGGWSPDQTVTKHSTSDVLGRDWSKVESEVTGHSKEKCKERYRLADTVVDSHLCFSV
jgi:hypothetical protein